VSLQELARRARGRQDLTSSKLLKKGGRGPNRHGIATGKHKIA
jgi:hypothetical protein